MNPMASYDNLENENLSVSGNSTEGETPGGNENPTEGETPGGNENPTEGETPGGNENPTEGETPGGNENPTEDTDAVQDALSSLREELNAKDTSIDDLSVSLRSLVDLMSADASQQSGVYTPPDIPFEAYQTWDYPITVDYLINVVGIEETLPQSATYDIPEYFLEDYQDMAWNCYKGDVFKDFSINKIQDSGGNILYYAQSGEEEPPEEEPVEDLTPIMLEVLQSMDTRLESLDAGLSTLSENTISYQEDSLVLQEQNNALQLHLLVTSIALGFTLFLVLGYIIAHGFWQRMKVG